MYFSLNFLLITYFTLQAKSSKILLIFSAPAPSHYILGNALARGLAEQGHNVTMISPFIDKNPPKNGSYRNIQLTGLMEKVEQEKAKFKLNMFDIEATNVFYTLFFMMPELIKIMDSVFNHENVQELIKSDETFDAVIVEQCMNDAQKSFAKYFNAPLILFSTIGASNVLNSLVGNPSPPSYIPDRFLSYSSEMTFCERLINSIFIFYQTAFHHLYLYPRQEKVVKKYLGSEIDFYDSLYNSSIVLLNSHPSINQPVPHVPNMIEIGGFHVKPAKKLPLNLQKYLDEASEGVIYFSMGSNLKSAELPVKKRDAILKVFSKVKQKVLWKWEDNNLPGKPENVKTEKWMPQQEILAHPNVKMFITHGGLLSSTETIYHGVPILTIPIFADQKLNARVAVKNGIGVSLPFSQITEETFENSIKEILNNPLYSQNAKFRSKLFHDREVKPMDTAIYWVEYVIRHKGAPHLRVAALDLCWIQYYLLDVFALLFAISLIILYIKYLIFKKIVKRFCNFSMNEKVKTH